MCHKLIVSSHKLSETICDYQSSQMVILSTDEDLHKENCEKE